jgi:hypothetical protein
VLLTFGLILRVAGLPLRQSWVLGLAWGASPALLSFSIAGYPYATGFLPHALALAIVASPRLRARPLASLALCLLATELSWHVYEAGKTLVVVFVLAALLEREARRATRLAWLAASTLQVILIRSQRGFNVDYVLSGGGRGPLALVAAAGKVLHALVLPVVDLPLLVPLAVLGLWLTRRYRWLLVGGAASQLLTLVLAAAVEASAIIPRRCLTTTFYCLTAVAIAFKEGAPAPGRRPLLRLALVTALLGGNLWQLAHLWIFFGVPPAGRTQPLPFTFSNIDYNVAAGVTDLAGKVRAEISEGRRVLLLCNLSSEYAPDPPGLLERAYLSLGHEPFVRSVLAFGSRNCRYDCLPIRPLEDMEREMAALAAGRVEAVAFYKKELKPRLHVEEAAVALAALGHSFVLRPGPDPAPGFGSLRLAARARATALPLAIENPTEPLPLDLIWMPRPRAVSRSVRTSPRGEEGFRYEWTASATAKEATAVDLLLGFDGHLRLSLDGEPVLDRRCVGFTLWRERWELRAGTHAVGLAYETHDGTGRLLLKLEAP